MNANQLMLALIPHVSKSMPIIDEVTWLDVSDLAKGAGFETQAAISVALADALAPNTHETETDYDQRLYDALWLANFQFSLNDRQSATFHFSFSNAQTDETCLRLHVKSIDQTTFLGLLEDF